MKMRVPSFVQKKRVTAALILAVLGGAGFVIGFRCMQSMDMAQDYRSQIRYLVEGEETIGEEPAATALSADYLENIFGEDPQLLDNLKQIIDKGLTDAPSIRLGEVSAMIVTYNRADDDNTIKNVAAHVIGGFPQQKRKPGFHRDGYFRGNLTPQLWEWGNSTVGFLGRDMVMFADPNAATSHTAAVESLFTGEIMPIVQTMDDPLYFSMVLPNPKNAVPLQLQRHILALIIKGRMSRSDGDLQAIVLTPSGRSARRTISFVKNLQTVAETLLRTKWSGDEVDNEWGGKSYVWWANEMLKTSRKTEVEKEGSIVRVSASFKRRMVNALLKGAERMGRDLAGMQGIYDDRLDPRLVDARLQTAKPVHYWSDAHRWGPNWPVGAPSTNSALTEQTNEQPSEQPSEQTD